MKQENKADALVLPIGFETDRLLRSILENGTEFLFSEPNLLYICSEARRASMEVLHRPELRDFISSGLKYESIGDFAQAIGVCEQLLSEAEEIFARTLTTSVMCDLVNACKTPLHVVWLVRAKQPKQYKTEMRALLRRIASLARTMYGAPNHRMSIHEDRDRDLWRLKKMHPEWSSGQLGLKFGLSRGAAELAYARQARREKRRLNRLHRIALACLPVDERKDLNGSAEESAEAKYISRATAAGVGFMLVGGPGRFKYFL